MAGALLAGIWAFPFFMLLNTAAGPAMLLAIFVASLFNDLMYGPQAALMTEIYSTEFRYSGASLGYQLGAIFGRRLRPDHLRGPVRQVRFTPRRRFRSTWPGSARCRWSRCSC